MIKGVFLILAGLLVWIAGFSIGLAWLGLCFGTVIIGLIMLFCFPTVLFLPFSIPFGIGNMLISAGTVCLSERR